MTKRVLIDTDPGIDDAAAILMALASPELSIEAMTTVFGNGIVEHCTRNALILIETAGRSDIPVYQGAGKPLTREANIGSAIHGEDAFGDVGISDPKGAAKETHAVQAMIDLVMDNPGEITLMALGPLTNVALALSLEPRIADAVAELVVMGGAVFTRGNASEVASANLYNDPEAAAIVYQSGAPVVQVGLDVCWKVQFSEEQLARINASDLPTMRLLSKITPFIASRYREFGNLRPGMAVQYNDVPAFTYAINPDLFEAHEYHVRISTHDELTKGQTVTDVTGRRGEPNATVLMDVDADGLTEMFMDRVLSYVVPSSA